MDAAQLYTELSLMNPKEIDAFIWMLHLPEERTLGHDADGDELVETRSAAERLTNSKWDVILTSVLNYVIAQHDKKGPHPRMGERDAEIVRLRDSAGLTWGEVFIEVKRQWPLNDRNDPITLNAVKAAYRAGKKLLNGLTNPLNERTG